MSVTSRVVVVRLCVEKLWASRADGRFAALEDALVEVLESKPFARRSPTLAKAPAGRGNVIEFKDFLGSRRGLDSNRARRGGGA